jgi:hypothetical protein
MLHQVRSGIGGQCHDQHFIYLDTYTTYIFIIYIYSNVDFIKTNVMFAF